MKIVDFFEGNSAIFYTVELAENRYVDIRVCDSGLSYPRRNDDGTAVYGYAPAPDLKFLTFPDYEYDEQAAIELAKEVWMQAKEG